VDEDLKVGCIALLFLLVVKLAIWALIIAGGAYIVKAILF
jgi:hypothetical protein